MNIFPSISFIYLFIIEFIFGIIGMILMARLYERIYGHPTISKGRLYIFSIILGAITAIIWRLILAYYRPTSTPPVIVVSSFLFLPFFFESNYKKKLFFSLALFTASCFWLGAYDFISTPMVNKIYWLIELMMHMGFWFILEIVGYVGRKKRQLIPTSVCLLLASISIVSLFIFFGEFYHIFNRDQNPYAYPIEIAIMLVLLFINITLFVLFDRFAAFTETHREHYLLEQQLQMQSKHYKQLEKLQNEIRTLHHDIRNYLNTATSLSSQGNHKELQQYLQSISNQITDYDQTILTGNPTMDTILNLKIAELRQWNITVKSDIHVPSNLMISFEQATIIFGNLLDNVREACEELPESSRWVCIELAYINKSLLIRITNSTLAEIKTWKNGLPLTKKNNKTNHGLGLKSVLQKVNENGSLKIKSDSNTFSVEIILYGL